MKKQNQNAELIHLENYTYVLSSGLNDDVKVTDRIYAEDIIDAYKKTLEVLIKLNELVSSVDEIEKFRIETVARI